MHPLTSFALKDSGTFYFFFFFFLLFFCQACRHHIFGFESRLVKVARGNGNRQRGEELMVSLFMFLCCVHLCSWPLTCRSICEGVQYKHERALDIMTIIQHDITNCEDRTIHKTEAHEILFPKRHTAMLEIKVSLCFYMTGQYTTFLPLIFICIYLRIQLGS